MTDTAVAAYLTALDSLARCYFAHLALIESRLRRDGVDDLNPVQAIFLFKIGDRVLTAVQLKDEGCYLGTNASYNLNVLQERGYISRKKGHNDKRTIAVALTVKGHQIRNALVQEFEHQTTFLEKFALNTMKSEQLSRTLTMLQKIWSEQVVTNRARL